ncbi:thioesterase family protein [uncultured Cocleimonas sp.]|uniref:acyl-CoA thioesterase n=1 Tax=uncultured Cocleimonas sp. TaxID=1051587 RepID=UPI002619E28E|nr:thioesterase family protein [uncultured Cocleimonas sp.]
MGVESKYLQDYRQMERADFVHFMNVQVRWGDADALGHINNTLYGRYYESSRLDYFEKLMGMHFTRELTSGVILADMKIAYLKQLHYPTEIEIGSRISRMGNSSLDFEAAVFIKDSEDLISTSRATLVWFDYKADKNKSIPDDKRKMINDYERIPPA